MICGSLAQGNPRLYLDNNSNPNQFRRKKIPVVVENGP